ncbi:MAG: response regulator, partial [Deltaproteobacteria bacterium]|nr:response regulator [Deltaproteobacteria bacterium]
DLILLDLLMPGMSGYEVCTRLKADPCTAAIPVIFVTGLSGESDEQNGLDLGAVDFIHKPFSPSLVRARVKNHLELQKHRNNLEKQVHDRTAELEVNNINLAKEIAIRSRTEAAMREQTALLVEQVNERKQAQERLLVKQQQLAELNAGLEDMVADEVHKNREKDGIMLHQDKLASIGHLAAGVAHEINNPMGFIMSNLGTLKGYMENLGQFTSLLQTIIATDVSVEMQRLVEEVAQKLDITYILQDLGVLIAESAEGAERVKQIVLDLKDFARSDQENFMEADLNDCVRSTVNIVRNEIKYVADLDLQLGDIPPVVCNPQQINQVIANLLLNATHAIEGHGTITVRTRCNLDKVFMTVSDTGCGVPAEIRSRIFDPFFTTKEVGKGTGLGLNICYNIVKKHAGEITLESEPGVGTSFTITLPVRVFGESEGACITASLPG